MLDMSHNRQLKSGVWYFNLHHLLQHSRGSRLTRSKTETKTLKIVSRRFKTETQVSRLQPCLEHIFGTDTWKLLKRLLFNNHSENKDNIRYRSKINRGPLNSNIGPKTKIRVFGRLWMTFNKYSYKRLENHQFHPIGWTQPTQPNLIDWYMNCHPNS